MPEQKSWLNRNVVAMGATSLLSDACHEMATGVLPGFLAVIGAAPSALGFIEGTSDATASFLKLWGGWVSDRFGHRKVLTTLGYALTGVSQSIFAFAMTWHLVLVGRLVGWFGRGFRSPIRDAMLADSVDYTVRGKAFGFHRAGDTVGAIVGPLFGVWLLSVWQSNIFTDPSRAYRTVFLITLVPGALSALVFWFMISDKREARNQGLKFWGTVRTLPRPFRRYLLGVGVFGIGDFAPTLMILAATTLMTKEYGLIRASQLAGLMYALRNGTYAAASFPIGALSDRVGRIPVLAGGYSLAVLTMVGFVLAFLLEWSRPMYLLFLFALAGVFIAAEDTLEGAITADFIPPETRTIGMGILGTVNGVGDFGASVLVGLLWTTVSPAVAFGFAATMMCAGTLFLLRTDNA